MISTKALIKVSYSPSGIVKLKRNKYAKASAKMVIKTSMLKMIHHGAFESVFRYVFKTIFFSYLGAQI